MFDECLDDKFGDLKLKMGRKEGLYGTLDMNSAPCSYFFKVLKLKTFKSLFYSLKLKVTNNSLLFKGLSSSFI